ncbi:MAG: DUF4126 domain-containing protein [Gemmatimonadales bacterium]
METWLSIAAGVGLAAACGFRVFVPLLIVSAAAFSGDLVLAPGTWWLGTLPALIALGTATVLEVAGYFIPWLDHALDVLATPTALVAGVLAAASVTGDLPPLVRWFVAIVAGGGSAGLVQGATTLLRLKSTALTGGLANPLVATLELLGATLTALLALFMPLACLLTLVLVCAAAFRASHRVVFGRHG